MAGLPYKLVSVIGLAASVAGWSRAQEPKKDAVGPKAPKVEPKGGPKAEPKKADPKEPEPPILDLLAAGGGAGASRTGESTTHAPNMYGDAFGGNRYRLNVFLGRLNALSQVTDNTLGAQNTPDKQRLSVNYGPGAGGGIVVLGAGRPVATYPGASPQFTSAEPYGTFHNQVRPVKSPASPRTTTIPILDNAAYRAAVDGVFTKLYGPAGVTLFSPNGSKLVYTTPVTEGSTGAVIVPGVAQLFYQYDRFSQLDVATPAGGGVVGRTKISEDNNPLPRDRVFFNTDYFSNTRLLAGGADVTRFAPGFEATFFDQLASVEVQFPFAATLSAVSSADGLTGRDTVFGNIFTALKALVYAEEGLSLSGGLGLAIPTSPDAVVKSADGGEFVRIKNESWNVVPFVAAIYAAPGSRFFWQNWASVTYDTTGSPVLANFDGAGQRRIGSLRDQSVLALDTQVGYWLIPYGSGTGFIQALSPFVELHYNTAIGDNATVRAGSLSLAPTNNRYDEVNLTTGMAAYLANNLLVSSSVVVPLSSGSNKFFEYQVGLRVSWFFGAAAANPVPAQLAP